MIDPPEDKLPLSAFPLSDPFTREVFLWSLERREGALIEATAHVWAEIAPPRRLRATRMGAAAGVGGQGKAAIHKMLARYVEEMHAIVSPPHPRRDDYADFDSWNEAWRDCFEVSHRQALTIVSRYSAILNGEQPDMPPGTGIVVPGPWKASARRPPRRS